jgi:hypothetical protein
MRCDVVARLDEAEPRPPVFRPLSWVVTCSTVQVWAFLYEYKFGLSCTSLGFFVNREPRHRGHEQPNLWDSWGAKAVRVRATGSLRAHRYFAVGHTAQPAPPSFPKSVDRRPPWQVACRQRGGSRKLQAGSGGRCAKDRARARGGKNRPRHRRSSCWLRAKR